jgi:CDP-glucose 4,6-dehydratase
MDRAFWQGKRVFLTGHTGFKGSWLALWLERLGAEVTGYALPPQGSTLFADAAVDRGITSIDGDLRDRAALGRAIEAADPEIVLHLAAQALVHAGYRDPIGTYETNVLGTAHLLEALRGRPAVRAVVSVTSDKCYQNNEWEWGYREVDPLGGHDPYSSSKACAELVTAAYRDSYFSTAGTDPSPEGPRAALATARSGNVIGGGDWGADRLVPDLVRGFQSGHPVTIRRPEATRPWQHVLEPLRGYLVLAERLWQEGEAFAEAWNFGPDDRDNRTVRWVADRMVEVWGGEARWAPDPTAHPPEATFLHLDCAKSRRRLGWLPVLPLDEALDWLVTWYREAPGGNPRQLTLDQIAEYESRLA